MMRLHELLERHRDEVINQWSKRIEDELLDQPALSKRELVDHIPRFIDDIIVNLDPAAVSNQGSQHAREHGMQRLRLGFNVDEVVREYGMLVTCILDLARDKQLALEEREYRTLFSCVHSGTADAIAQYVWQRDQEQQRHASEHLGFIAHELRNPLTTARMAVDVLRAGVLSQGGRVVQSLESSLMRVSSLIENALTQAWLKAGAIPERTEVVVDEVLAEVVQDHAVEAEHKQIDVSVITSPGLNAEADPRMLRSIVGNLLHNALKFTPPGGRTVLRSFRREEWLILEVEDSCGGLKPDTMRRMFEPFTQNAQDRSGFGLGLAIAMQAAQAHGGTISVRNVQDHGCVMVVELPLFR
jgi:signal transduction histidine kinase